MLISDSKIKKCFYVNEGKNEEHSLIHKNIKTFIEYFSKQFKKEFILVDNLKELFRISLTFKGDNLLICDKSEEIDKIYNIE